MEKNILTVIGHLQKKTSRHIDRVKLQDFTLQNVLNVPIHWVGSRGDGSNDSNSDTDLTYIVAEVIASEVELNEYKLHEYGLQVLWADCHHGYCRLLFKRYDVAGSLYKISAGLNGCVSSEKFKQWASTKLTGIFRPYGGQLLNVTDTHGPCNAPKHVFGNEKNEADIDFALSIQCDDWPSVANEWLQRDRKYDWPSNDLISDVRDTKCIFVPIGYSKEMKDKEWEWRVSFNMAERLLMWSLNGTQLLCFEALKTLHLTLISVKFPDIICSYFLKTILFWVLEETASDFWIPENFTECLKMCLNRLMSSLTSGKCEHYFVRCNNMFDRKPEHDLLQVARLIQELDIEGLVSEFIDHKWNYFQQNVMFQHHIPVNSLSICRHAIHAKLAYVENSKKVSTLYKFIGSLNDCNIDKNTVHQLQETLRSTIGALQIATQDQNDVFASAMQLLEQSDVPRRMLLQVV